MNVCVNNNIVYTDIAIDQAIKVCMKTIYGNSLVLDFKFYDQNKDPYPVTGVSFTFTISDEDLKKVKYQVVNSQWTRPVSNEIKYSINPLSLAVGTYNIDFTATYADGVVQTLMDGYLNIRARHKV